MNCTTNKHNKCFVLKKNNILNLLFLIFYTLFFIYILILILFIEISSVLHNIEKVR